MKKSKIVIPALAMIAFSTAASIAGTVAWFTASRQVTVDAGSYAVVKTTSNLDAVLDDTDAVGATVSGKTVSITGKLTDASFNHSSGKVYQPNSDGTGFHPTNPEVSLDDTDFESKVTRATVGTDTIYSVVTWDITFKVAFGVTPGDYGLYLDCADDTKPSAITVPGVAQADYKTAKGFRMAFYGTSSHAEKKVYAGLQQSSKCTYVSTNTAAQFASGTAYTANELVYSGYNAALPGSTATISEATGRPDYLGYFAFQASTTVELHFTVVCWFEGTDENIVNQPNATDYQTVKADLTFSAVPIADHTNP